MKFVDSTQQRAKRMAWPTLLFFLLFYTYLQLLTGERNINTWYNLSGEISSLEKDIYFLETERDDWRLKVNRLRTATLDADYVEELIRRDTPMIRENEILVLIDWEDEQAIQEENKPTLRQFLDERLANNNH